VARSGLPAARREKVSADAVEAAMGVARALVAVSVESMAVVGDVVTLPQLRVLVVVQARGPLDLGALAAVVGIHVSNASRTCDRLVVLGLLERADDPTDRRHIELRLSPAGAALLDAVLGRRRELVTGLLSRLTREQLHTLTPLLSALADAAVDVTRIDQWTELWTS